MESDARLLRRWNGPVVVSYAQNGEDVRLWRAFEPHVGFYVDVGAGHPVTHSVTKLFYDAGWSGINIEPGPTYEAFASSRPRDVNLPLAISRESGEAVMWITSPDPGLSSLVRPAAELLPPGFSVSPRTVRRARLDEVLEEHARGRRIDFLKIDVEGTERDVLESIDLTEIRPTVVVVEAISPLDFRPTYGVWEPLLLAAGYVRAAFDGLNRFYAHEEHSDLVAALEYPVTVLDRYVLHDSQWRRDSSLRDPQHDELLRAELRARDAEQRLEAFHQTLSWRVTRPLRAVRRMQLSRHLPRGEEHTVVPPEADRPTIEDAFAGRLLQAAQVLSDARVEAERPASASGIDGALEVFEAALGRSPSSREAAAWLGLVAVDGRYPTDEDLRTGVRTLRASGPVGFGQLLKRRFDRSVEAGRASTAKLDVVRDGVVVIAQTAVLTDMHTGIQRVARETIARWLEASSELQVCCFDSDLGALVLLDESELDRIRGWREHAHGSGAPIRDRVPVQASGDPLVPWSTDLILSELVLGRQQSRALASLASAQVPRSLSIIAFDLIPVVAAETVDVGLSEMYCDYLSVVKRSDRISAISRQTARDFCAFTALLEAEGLEGPEVAAQPLPTVAPELDDTELAAGLAALGLLGIPLVLVVGVHVPRKNHHSILEASERLWLQGLGFELLFIGGYESTSGRDFDAYLGRLRADGWPVRIRRRGSEAELWAAYGAARCTVYPSFIEGFGLPIAESLASGTPVITSNYGSMAEIAEGGGALLVDPRDVGDLEERMRQVLTNDELYERLRREALARDFGSWDDYARDVWDFFTQSRRA